MFLRLNRADGVTNIFNLDNVASVYIDADKAAIEFSPEEYFAFYKEQHPEEYELLKSFFREKLDDVHNLTKLI